MEECCQVNGKSLVKIVIALSVLYGGYSGAMLVKDKLHMKRAKKHVADQKYALAKNELDRMWCLSPKKVDDCQMVLDVLLRSSDINKMEFIAEFCESKGVKDKTIPLYKSKARELRGDLQGAAAILGQELQTNDKDPDLFFTLGTVLVKMKNGNGALNAIIKSFQVAGENLDAKIRATTTLIEIGAKEQAAQLVDLMAQGTYQNGIPYLVLARLYGQLQNQAKLKEMVEKGTPMLAGLDQKTQAQVQQQFGDVFQAAKSDDSAVGKKDKKKSVEPKTEGN